MEETGELHLHGQPLAKFLIEHAAASVLTSFPHSLHFFSDIGLSPVRKGGIVGGNRTKAQGREAPFLTIDQRHFLYPPVPVHLTFDAGPIPAS